MADRVDITVAICTWNRADLLDQTLAGMGGLTPPAGRTWELVVVDNNSTDHSQQVLAKHAAAGVLPLRTGFEATQGHCHARNRCLDLARGSLVLWSDDDVLVDPDWLAALAAAADRHPTAAAFGGPVAPWFPVPPDPDLAAAFPPLAAGYCGVDHGPTERELGPDELVFGANMGFNQALTADLRFDTTLGRRGGNQNGFDDTDFVARARRRGPLVYVPAARVRHYVAPERMTLAYARRYTQDGYRRAAVGRDPSPHLFGVPRWLLRKYLAAAAGQWGWKPRADRLRSRIDRWRLAAMIAEYRRTAGGGATG